MFESVRRLFAGEKKSGYDIANPSPQMLELFGALPTSSGVQVSPDTALRCVPFYTCVKILSETVGQLPLILYRREASGERERATDHPAYRLLKAHPNPWTTAYDFRQSMQTALCLHGNAFAFINRDREGRAVELIQIPSRHVTVDIDLGTLEPEYQVTLKDGRQQTYNRRDILHLKTIGTESHVGISPVWLAREAIALSLVMEKHGARLFGKGARPAGVLKYAKWLNPESLKRLKQSFRRTHEGAETSGETLILEDGMEFEPLQFNSTDAQFLELRRFQVAEISRVLRIPLHFLNDLERATHNNAEAMGQQFLTFGILPWLEMWQQAIEATVLSDTEREDYYVEFLTDDLARADIASRFTAYSQAITNGILSPNEVRAAENRPPYPGGDQFRLPMNTENADGTQDT